RTVARSPATALERPPAALPMPAGSPDAVRAKPLKPAAQHAFSSSQGGASAGDRRLADRASSRSATRRRGTNRRCLAAYWGGLIPSAVAAGGRSAKPRRAAARRSAFSKPDCHVIGRMCQDGCDATNPALEVFPIIYIMRVPMIVSRPLISSESGLHGRAVLRDDECARCASSRDLG